jgi:hypothetical protein
MEYMERRRFLVLLPAAAATLIGAEASVFRGKLTRTPSGAPALLLGGKLVPLDGDPDTVGVLKDARLANADFEVIGQLAQAQEAAGSPIRINPIHTRALFTYKNGRRLMVTYWCDVCAIRTYTPGICWCCREETALDLIEPDTVEKA